LETGSVSSSSGRDPTRLCLESAALNH